MGMITSREFASKVSNSAEVILITHDNCADGNMSVLLMHQFRARTSLSGIDVRKVQYNSKALRAIPDEPLKHPKSEPLYVFVDMTPPADQAAWYAERNTIIIDHHVAQAGMLEQMFDGRYLYSNAPGMAGCTLLASLICNSIEHLPWYQLAVQVGIRDTWAKGLVQHNQELWDSISAVSEAIKFMRVSEVMTIKEVRQRIKLLAPILALRKKERLASQRDNATTVNIEDLTVVICPYTDISDVADYFEEADVVVGYSFFENTGMKLSLRTRREEIDCAAFARAFPGCYGGGHRMAAGMTIPMPYISDNPVALIMSMVTDNYRALTGA